MIFLIKMLSVLGWARWQKVLISDIRMSSCPFCRLGSDLKPSVRSWCHGPDSVRAWSDSQSVSVTSEFLFGLRTATGEEDAVFPVSCIHWPEERKSKSEKVGRETGREGRVQTSPLLSQGPLGPESWRLKVFLLTIVSKCGGLGEVPLALEWNDKIKI